MDIDRLCIAVYTNHIALVSPFGRHIKNLLETEKALVPASAFFFCVVQWSGWGMIVQCRHAESEVINETITSNGTDYRQCS